LVMVKKTPSKSSSFTKLVKGLEPQLPFFISVGFAA
jgi:hypothetical protein